MKIDLIHIWHKMCNIIFENISSYRGQWGRPTISYQKYLTLIKQNCIVISKELKRRKLELEKNVEQEQQEDI